MDVFFSDFHEIHYNGLNMVRLAFQHSNLPIYYYIYLLISSSILALSAKCTIFFVGNRFHSYPFSFSVR